MDGGVQVAWKNGDLHLRLFCAPTPTKSYIYVSYTANGKTADSLMMPSVDVFTLADSVHWLRTREWPKSPSPDAENTQFIDSAISLTACLAR
jgi:hypothetical protein